MAYTNLRVEGRALLDLILFTGIRSVNAHILHKSKCTSIAIGIMVKEDNVRGNSLTNVLDLRQSKICINRPTWSFGKKTCLARQQGLIM